MKRLTVIAATGLIVPLAFPPLVATNATAAAIYDAMARECRLDARAALREARALERTIKDWRVSA